MRDKGAVFFLVGLLAIVGFLLYRIAQPFLGPVMTATVLAVALAPMHRSIRKWVKGRTLAAILSTVIGLVLTLVPLGLIGYKVAGEVNSLYQGLKEQSNVEGGWGPFFTQAIERPLEAVSGVFPISKEGLRKEIVNRVGDVSNWIVGKSGAALGSVGTTIFAILITFLALFFFLKDGDDLLDGIAHYMPLKTEHVQRLFGAVGETIIANVHGVLAVAVVQGTLLTLGLWVAGVPSPLVWGLVAAFCSMIPILGTGVVWVPATLTLFFQGNLWHAIGLLLYSAFIVGNSDNVIRVIVIGSRVKQHPLLIFFSILGGLRSFGLLGILLGPVVVSIAVAVFRSLQEELDARAGEEKPAHGETPPAPPPGAQPA